MKLTNLTQIAYASHHQFYVEDAIHPGDTGDPSFWFDQAFHDRLAVSERTLGIRTGSYGDVGIITEIHDTEPAVAVADWDHVTEAGLSVTSGVLRVIGCLAETGDAFSVAPGNYRVRCCHADLEFAVHDGQGSEWYLVQIWPAPIVDAQILKRWEED